MLRTSHFKFGIIPEIMCSLSHLYLLEFRMITDKQVQQRLSYLQMTPYYWTESLL